MAHGRQTFLNSAADMKWLREVHLPQVGAGTYKSAILYGNEDWPSRIELFKAKSPRFDDTCVVYEDDGSGAHRKGGPTYVRTGTAKPGVG